MVQSVSVQPPPCTSLAGIQLFEGHTRHLLPPYRLPTGACGHCRLNFVRPFVHGVALVSRTAALKLAFSEAVPGSSNRPPGVASTRLVSTAWIRCVRGVGGVGQADRVIHTTASAADVISTPDGIMRVAMLLGGTQHVWVGELEGDAYRAAMRYSRDVSRSVAPGAPPKVPEAAKDTDPSLVVREVTTYYPGIHVLHVAWLTAEVLLLVAIADVATVAGLREVRGALYYMFAPTFTESRADDTLPGGWRLRREPY